MMNKYSNIEDFIKKNSWTPGKGLSAFDSSSNYMGENKRDWVVGLVRTRDSQVIENCNFNVLLERLGGEQEDCVEIFRVGHWAVGWCEYILVHKSATKELQILMNALNSLDNYPILDETAYAEAEMEEQHEILTANFSMWANEVIDELPEAEVNQNQKELNELIAEFYYNDCNYRGVEDGWFRLKEGNNYTSDCDLNLKDNKLYQKLKEKFGQ